MTEDSDCNKIEIAQASDLLPYFNPSTSLFLLLQKRWWLPITTPNQLRDQKLLQIFVFRITVVLSHRQEYQSNQAGKTGTVPNLFQPKHSQSARHYKMFPPSPLAFPTDLHFDHITL